MFKVLKRITLFAVVVFLHVQMGHAMTLETSPRPMSRPAIAVSSGAGRVKSDDATALPINLASVSTRITRKLRPVARPVRIEKKRWVTPEDVLSVSTPAGFSRWTKRFRGKAIAAGIRPAVFDEAFRNLQYLPDVIKKDRNQSEFTKTIWQYLDSAVSEKRLKNGQSALIEHAKALSAIEARYGVDKEVVAAIWGLESAYGTYRGDVPVVSALATLSYEGRRGRFFEKQLVAALKILQAGDVTAEQMTGSWAGAMGHTQFIPTSYLDLAVDFSGDGKRDIWSDNPLDALASTAAYLKRFGWQKGKPWGVEVKLPADFNYSLTGRKIRKKPSEWAKLGVVGTDGQPVEDFGVASVLLPAGAKGAAFLIFKNFSVIERYNTADAYVIGVGHLADRLKGKGPIATPWPRDDRGLSFDERKEMQRRLNSAGYRTHGVDGKIGPNTQEAIKRFQRAKGLSADGYASLSLLKRLRR